MTDEQLAAYETRIAPLRLAYHRVQYQLEDDAAAGIERDLEGLRGVHGDVVAFIERRWTRWLDRALARLDARYQHDAARIRKEVGIT